MQMMDQNRLYTKINNNSNVKEILRNVEKQRIEVRVVVGLNKYWGKILYIKEDFFSIDVDGNAEEYFNRNSRTGVYTTLRILYDKYYYKLDCKIIDIFSDKREPHQKHFLWVLEYPSDIRKSINRSIRIKPEDGSYIVIPPYSTSRLKVESAKFVGIDDYCSRITELDRAIFLTRRLDCNRIYKIVGQELKRIAVPENDDKDEKPNFKFILKEACKKNILNRMNELWIKDTRRLQKKEEKNLYFSKNIGSMVALIIKNQLNTREGYITLTRSLNQPGITEIEKEYILALGTRLLAANKMKTGNSLDFKVKDISEEGLAIYYNKNILRDAGKGTIIRDIKLYLKGNEKVKINTMIIRKTNNFTAMRIAYPDYASRLRVRQYIETFLISKQQDT